MRVEANNNSLKRLHTKNQIFLHEKQEDASNFKAETGEFNSLKQVKRFI